MVSIIRNGVDLKEEIFRLEALNQEQLSGFRDRFHTPRSAFQSIMSIFPATLHPNYFGMAARIVLPFVLNRTIFRNSNFLIRALVGLLSQKAAGYISEQSVETAWGKLKSLFSKHQNEKKHSINSGNSASGSNDQL